MSTPDPHFFLTESGLDALEELRKLVLLDRRSAEHGLAQLRNALAGHEALPYVDQVEASVKSLHTLLLSALDARTAELTDEATGYQHD